MSIVEPVIVCNDLVLVGDPSDVLVRSGYNTLKHAEEMADTCHGFKCTACPLALQSMKALPDLEGMLACRQSLNCLMDNEQTAKTFEGFC